jgi:hypothetical protein
VLDDWTRGKELSSARIPLRLCLSGFKFSRLRVVIVFVVFEPVLLSFPFKEFKECD